MPDIWQVLTALASLGAFFMSLYTLMTARNHKDVADLLAAKTEYGNRLLALEGKVDHLPDTEMVHGLTLSIAEMKGQIAVIVERVGPIKAIAERLQESFLEHGR
jgi:hypothetical protein